MDAEGYITITKRLQVLGTGQSVYVDQVVMAVLGLDHGSKVEGTIRRLDREDPVPFESWLRPAGNGYQAYITKAVATEAEIEPGDAVEVRLRRLD